MRSRRGIWVENEVPFIYTCRHLGNSRVKTSAVRLDFIGGVTVKAGGATHHHTTLLIIQSPKGIGGILS